MSRGFRYAAAILLCLAAFFLHFLLERRQGRLVALHLGEPLSGHVLPTPPGPSPERPKRVWIDTDAGCGVGRHVDVDDCFAVAVALTSPELDVRGVGTIFGNVPLAAADSVTRDLVSMLRLAGQPAIPVHRGTPEPASAPTRASRALAQELADGPLTVLALGPLTNLAATLAADSGLARNVEALIFVGGKRPGQWMHPGYDHFLTFSDFNTAQDPDAVERVLAAGIPIVLVPFEAALEVVVAPADLRRMASAGPTGRWLAERSGEWMRFWREEGGRQGFVPFDNAAVLYALRPALFRCVPVRARLETSPPWFGIGRPTELVVRDAPGGEDGLRYCHQAGTAFGRVLRERLDAASRHAGGAGGRSVDARGGRPGGGGALARRRRVAPVGGEPGRAAGGAPARSGDP